MGKAHLHTADSEYISLNTFELIKGVSDTVFDMINDLDFTGATFREELVSHHRAVYEANSCLHMRRAGSKTVAQTKEYISKTLGRTKE